MSVGVNESRFFMWRAVIAMAHADKHLDAQERELVEGYLKDVSFSDEQRNALRADLEKPKGVGKMFSCITDPEDRATFFQFARMMAWSDGDFDAQEKKILETLESEQMDQINAGLLSEIVRQSRDDARIQRLKQDEQFEQSAKSSLGIGAIFSRLYW